MFDCAFKPAKGKRSIQYMAHLKMMAAAQPFLSGAISKTVNMPQESTVEDIMQTLHRRLEARPESGGDLPRRLQAFAAAQHVEERRRAGQGRERSAPKENDDFKNAHPRTGSGDCTSCARASATPVRHRLPDTRQAITHKFDIAGHEGYITVGLFEDGTPGELFITMAKEGSTIGGLMDTIGTLVSLALQYGVPLETLVNKFAHQRFEPSGFTKNPDIPIAKSITDYLFRWLGCQFIPGYREANRAERRPSGTAAQGGRRAGKARRSTVPCRIWRKRAKPPAGAEGAATELSAVQQLSQTIQHFMQDAPACDICGAITVRNGACYKCLNCGNSMGCS